MTANDLKIMEDEIKKIQYQAVKITATTMDLFTSLRIVVEHMESKGWHREGDGYNPIYTRALNSLEAVRRKGSRDRED